MKNVVICDHCRPENLQSLREGLTNFGHTVVISLHQDPSEVHNDIVQMCTNPTREKPRPDVAVTDLIFSTREHSVPAEDVWGCRLIRLLRQDPTTQDIRIMVRSRYLNNALYLYLYNLGISPQDIINRFGTNIRRIAEQIG